MRKRIVAILVICLMAIGLPACGDSSAENASEASNSEETKEPTDLTGTWKSEENEGAWMEATITSDSIQIDWVSDEGKTKSIYWVGTYEAPTEAVTEYSWTSERNKEETDSALLASTDDTKEFSYANDVISYEVSAMGTTTTMELEKSE